MSNMKDAMETWERAKLAHSFATEAAKATSTDLRAAETALLDLMAENGLKTAANDHRRFTARNETVVGTVDWEAVHGYMLNTGALDLVQKRLSITALKGRMDLGENIPGVELREIVKLQATKK